MSWIHEAKAASLQLVAQEVGLSVVRAGSHSCVRPCPACGATKRGSRDSRAPGRIYGASTKFQCAVCKYDGDGIDLVALSLHGSGFSTLDKRDKQSVRAWFEQAGIVVPRPGFRRGAFGPVRRRAQELQPPADPAPTPIDRAQLAAIWKASTSLTKTKDTKALEFLVNRGLDPKALAALDIARVLPKPNAHQWPDFWPGSRSRVYRIATLAYDRTGKAMGLHARAPFDATPKTKWHNGSASGLFFCNPQARRFLAQKTEPADLVLLTEGITDFWAASSACYAAGSRWLVLGCTAGSFAALGDLDLPTALDVVVATDPDEQGERYAAAAARSLPGHRLVRLPLAELSQTGGAHDRS